MSRYANKVEKIESGNWVMKSLVLLGGWILEMVVFGLLETLGTAVGLGFLETAAGAVSGVLFVAYLVLTLALYTVTGIWGYIGHLFKEAFLLPWKFTPVFVFAWMFVAIQVAIGGTLAAVVELAVLFCPPLVMHLAKNHYQAKCVLA